ncbi:MAG: hypothetical protein REI96_21870, partial [Flavobacterium nitrogenifigens]|uniref:hypothetical protein n=1 Tax=Flavobacterium nitrogenifigens TaxID=1617283 RepID=UPI0028069533
MKIVVKRKNRYAKVLKVNFYGKRIIGELVLFQFFKEQIPNGQNFHIHFIYFEDGNYHFSIKYFDSTTIEYVERRTYYNHVSTRKSTEKNFKNCTVEKRDRIPGEMLDMFMMEE